ncbi:DUF262 domain-containing protein [Halonatronum saccharophilum]|uniref:DUF262 domain-containing protein n=1 Tax=Halonatronum saccharophilum TaxID=150060 RepID=UPI0004848FA6|nr:DUF262 domain-containing protein [Halonatronum saccharophilum]
MKEYLKEGYSLENILEKIVGEKNDSAILNNNLEAVLPNFQREYKWDQKQQKKLLASFLVNIPIGSFLFLKGRKDTFSAKEIGYRQLAIDSERIGNDHNECLYLLDGQQRLTALYTMFFDFIGYHINLKNSKSYITYESVPKSLRNRWFLNLNPDIDGEKNVFGYEYLKFDETIFEEKEPEDILDYIVYKNIVLSKEKGEWYHPSSEEKKFDDLNFHSGNLIIPIYYLYEKIIKEQEPNTLMHKMIRKVGEARKEVIIDEIIRCCREDDEEKLEEIYIKVLKPYDIEIEEVREFYLNSKNENKIEDRIRDAFSLHINNWVKDIISFLKARLRNDLSAFILPEKEIGRAITIFENMNRGGVELDTYDLIVAKAARKLDESLTKLIEDRINLKVQIPKEIIKIDKSNISSKIEDKVNIYNDSKLEFNFNNFEKVYDHSELNNSRIKKQFLNLLSIFNYVDKKKELLKTEHLRRKKKLSLNASDISLNYEEAIDSLIKGYSFMHYRLGITKVTDVNYRLMVLPISYCFRNGWFESDKAKEKYDKIEYWYWVSLFSGRYANRQSQRCVSDIIELENWIQGKSDGSFIIDFEEKVFNFEGYSDESLLTRKDNKIDISTAIIDGINQYIISNSPKDLYKPDQRISAWDIANKEIEKENHHIIPKKSLPETLREDSDIKEKIESPLNKTPILGNTNNKISNSKLEEYIKPIVENENAEGHILRGHCIPGYINNLIDVDNLDDYENVIDTLLEERFKDLRKGVISELKELR